MCWEFGDDVSRCILAAEAGLTSNFRLILRVPSSFYTQNRLSGRQRQRQRGGYLLHRRFSLRK